MSLNNLAVYHCTRYKQLGARGNLDEAIFLDREALDLCPQGHPDRSMSPNNLADRLSSRYEQLWEMQDLDEAIVLAREALYLCNRFTQSQELQDIEELSSLYAQLVYAPQIVSSFDLSAA